MLKNYMIDLFEENRECFIKKLDHMIYIKKNQLLRIQGLSLTLDNSVMFVFKNIFSIFPNDPSFDFSHIQLLCKSLCFIIIQSQSV